MKLRKVNAGDQRSRLKYSGDGRGGGGGGRPILKIQKFIIYKFGYEIKVTPLQKIIHFLDLTLRGISNFLRKKESYTLHIFCKLLNIYLRIVKWH